MFQNGMSEEVPNYFMQEEAAKHAHEVGVRGGGVPGGVTAGGNAGVPFDVDQTGMFRNQFMVDPRTQLMGQQFHQFSAYPGAAFPKVVNGDYNMVDPRMQQLQQQLQQQQFRAQIHHQQQQQQGYFDPLQQQLQQQQHQASNFVPAYDFQRQQQQQQALHLARQQQELYANQGMQQLQRPPPPPPPPPVQLQQQQPMLRQMVAPQMDYRNQVMPVVDTRQHFMGHQMAKPHELQQQPQPESSESIENLHDLFGGVEKLFGDDQLQEAKTAIPGLGSLGASLINGCEAELFGDSASLSVSAGGDGQLFNRGMFRSKVPEPLVDGSHHGYPPKVATMYGGVQTLQPHYAADGLQFGQQQQQPPPPPRMDLQADGRWQPNNQMSRGTLQLFRDMDETTESGGGGHTGYMSKQLPGYDHGMKGQPGLHREGSGADSQDSGRQSESKQRESPQMHFQAEPGHAGHWVKQPISKPAFHSAHSHSSPGGERVSSPPYRMQPDRLLLDPGKQQHQGEDVQRMLQNQGPNLMNHGQGMNQGPNLMGPQNPGPNLMGPQNQGPNHMGAQNLMGPQNPGPNLMGQQQSTDDGSTRLTNHHQGDPSPGMKSRAYYEALEQKNATMVRNNNVNASNGPTTVSGSGGAYAFQGYAEAQRKMTEGGGNQPSFPWNISVTPRQNSTPDAWLRNNSLEVPYKSTTKPGFGATSMAHTDTPSTSEVVKPGKDTTSYNTENGPSSSSTGLSDYRLSGKNNLHIQEKMPDVVESEAAPPPPAAAAGLFRSQSNPPRFSSPAMGSLQEMNKRHFGVKDKEAMISTSIFQTSAAQAAIKSPLQAPPRQQQQQERPHFQHMEQQQQQQERALVHPQQEKVQVQHLQQERPQLQHMQSLSAAAPSGIGDATGGQTSGGLYGRPSESDSINDIVQQQHQARVVPSVAELPKPDQQHAPKSMPFNEAGPAARSSEDDERTTAMMKRNESLEKHFGQQQQQQLASFGSMGSQQQQLLQQQQHVQQQQHLQLQQPAVKIMPQQAPAVQQEQVPQQQRPSTPVPEQMQVSKQPVMEQPTAQAQAPTVPQQQQQQLFMGQGNLAGQQSLNPTLDLQRIMQSQSQMTLNQQQVQAALQAYAMAKSSSGGGGTAAAPAPPPVVSSATTEATTSAAAGATTSEQPKQHLLLNSVLPKKRKLETPPLSPWRMTISQQSGGALPTIRPPELQWAAETNRLPEKEGDDDFYAQDESLRFITRARQRLKFTTQLVQHTLPPVPAELMQSKTVEDRESATYVLARLSLGEACRITPNEDQQAKKTSTNSELIVEGYKDRIKYLENSLQRLESLPLTLEFVKNTQYLDKVCVTNRLMKCHQELFPVNFSSQRRIQPVHRSYPQPYVTASPMPSTIPGGYQLVPL